MQVYYFAETDKLLQEHVTMSYVAGNIAYVTQYGKTVYSNSFGFQDIESQDPAQLNSIFRIASMTKPITAVAILQLIETGVFTLNTPLMDILPEFENQQQMNFNDGDIIYTQPETPVTIHHLLSNTSGISSVMDPNPHIKDVYSKINHRSQKKLNESINEAVKYPLVYQSGQNWSYGSSSDLLGFVIERVTGLPLELYFQKYIFHPLGMEDTSYYIQRNKLSRLFSVYANVEGRLEKVEENSKTAHLNKDNLQFGGSGLLSTVKDFAVFCEMLLNRGTLNSKTILSRKFVDLMLQNHVISDALPISIMNFKFTSYGFGYGLAVKTNLDNTFSIAPVGEGFWVGAFNTYFWIDVQNQISGIYISQMVYDNPVPFLAKMNQFQKSVYQSLNLV